MSIFADNIRHLRAQSKLSQQKLADKLIIGRERLRKYEEGVSEPPFEILLKISQYFHVSVDILITVNLKKIPVDSVLKMENNRIILPITVDKQGKDYIEILPHKARAGYLQGYSDPEFILKMQQMRLPFITSGKHRAFPIEGDSMPPHKEGSFIVGKYIENISDIKDGKTYVLLTRNDGIVYKRVFRKNKKESTLTLHSDNIIYSPYEIKQNDLLEIWEHVCSFCTKEFRPEDLNLESVGDMFRQLRKEIGEVKATLFTS